MININTVWADILDRLSVRISSAAYETWMMKLEPIFAKENKLILSTPFLNVKKTVEKSYLSDIKQAMNEARSVFNDLEIILDNQKEEYLSRAKENEESLIFNNSDRNNKETAQFIKHLTFDNFVVGSSNQYAAAAAMSVADNPGAAANPLFIYGGVGLGKTHLLHAIGNTISKNKPKLRIIYVTAESFTNELIYSIRNAANAELNKEFREKYRNTDVLMIDDIQFFIGKTSTQEALFHIFNDLHRQDKQIILSSDRPIKELIHLEERLSSRFASGIVANIEPPSLETRIAILQKKAMFYKFNLSDEVLRYIAEKGNTNIRILEGMLRNVIFYGKLNNKSVNDINTVKEALKDYTTDNNDIVTVSNIIEATCTYFNISSNDIIGKKKSKEIVYPRQIAIYIITEMLSTVPLVSIGQAFGNRDHTTIIHARNKITEELKTNTKLKVQVNDIKNLVLRK
ncbi:MAG: chromosomal replication initiator protein DnaA [Christensenellales bacterium]|jgi:chromosomal replication initiator protein